MVFTLPHEYLILWQFNTAWFTQALFKASRDTLATLLADEKYLGVTAGIIMALHTWGRQLNLHPHLHVLLTGGGMTPQGEWKQPDTDFILPIKVIKTLYRGKIQDMLLKAVARGELEIPPKQSRQNIVQTIKQLYKKEWSVRIEKPYPYGDGVINYLSRYITGGPIKAKQIKYANAEQIAFSYKDHRAGRVKQLNLKKDEFIRRIFLHVPAPNTHTVRHYGLYSSASKQLAIAKALLPDQECPMRMEKVSQQKESQVRCPCCGMEMVLIYQSNRFKKGNSYIKNTVPKQSTISVQQGVEVGTLSYVPP